MNSDSNPPAKSFTRFFPAIARVLLGLVFFASAITYYFNLVPQPKDLPEKMLTFMAGMVATGYMLPTVKALELICGGLLLVNRFVPLALTLLAPIIVNIFALNAFLAPTGLPIAIVIGALEVYLAWAYRSAFRPMLAPRVTPG